jgi:hypothetical protein
MSFLQRFKALDVYRDVPKDLTNQTVTGAAGMRDVLAFFACVSLCFCWIAAA